MDGVLLSTTVARILAGPNQRSRGLIGLHVGQTAGRSTSIGAATKINGTLPFGMQFSMLDIFVWFFERRHFYISITAVRALDSTGSTDRRVMRREFDLYSSI